MRAYFGSVVKDHEIVPVLHQNTAGLPAFGRSVARHEIANLAFAHEFSVGTLTMQL